jgi:hypothetical protein
MRSELLEIANHCRIMSDHTTDLTAAREFRKLADRLEKIAADAVSAIDKAASISTEVTR